VKLAKEPDASFSLFLKANLHEGELERRTAQALRHNGPVDEPGLPPLDTDDDIQPNADKVPPSEDEEPASDSDSSSDSDADSDDEEGSDSASEEDEVASSRRSNHAQLKPGPKAKKLCKERTMLSRLAEQDNRRKALYHATRTQQDPGYKYFAGQAGASQKKPNTRSRTGGQGGESGRKRQDMEKEQSCGE
jgi:hypothetical protein